VYVHQAGTLRLSVHHPPVHDGDRGGDPVTDDTQDVRQGPAGRSRRQLLRHTAWFGSAVVLTVAGGEVISHVAGTGPAGAADATALRFVQISDSLKGADSASRL